MLRRLAPLVALVAALAVPSSAGAAAMMIVDGRGWGHGIGLSQWGTQGFALQGTGYRAILAHYYPGTTLGAAPIGRVRVLVAEKGSVRVGSAGRIVLRGTDGQARELEPGQYAFGPALRLQVAGEAVQLSGPVTLTPAGPPLTVDGKPYRGLVSLHVEGRTVLAVNDLPLEYYLYGVVPHEMPAGWHPEALKTQAVVARTYALVTRRPGRPFDLYADVRSQVYSGLAAEDPRTNAAVDATAGQVVRHGDALAHTFFFSTSGGRTAAVQDVWPAARPVPYLVSRPDPHDRLSPHHTWGPVVFTGADIRRRIGVLPDDVVVTTNQSDRVQTLRVIGRNGERSVGGADARTRLELRSSWFTVRLLTLEGPPRANPGQIVALRGRLRGLPTAGLQRRVGTGPWERVGAIRAGANGRFAVQVRVNETTTYRLAAANRTGAAIRIAVDARTTSALARAPR